jgi:hypothetical protein
MSQANRTPQVIADQQSALARLGAALAAGSVTVVIGQAGGIAFKGWKDNRGVTDLCAYRALTAANSAPLRRALARAEAVSGRKINPQALAAGTHSHDGGRTWGNH